LKRVNPTYGKTGRVIAEVKAMAKLEFEIIPLEEVPRDDAAAVNKEDRPLVLIVDDERIIADTLAMILSKSGYRVRTAYGGEVAFKLACEARPDLLLTDVAMPGMTGIELAIGVKETIPSCKILLFSGHASTMDALAEARDLGYDFNLLTKPVHPSDMLRRVSECLAFPEAMGADQTASFSHLAQ
jgi:DNA-binding NtrC family response regulator